MKTNFTSRKGVVAILAVMAVVTSCYTIKRVGQAHEVAAGGEFTSRSVVIYAEGDNQSANSYGCFGIRVPEGWTVTLPSNAYEQWEKGEVTATNPMIANEKYTAICNHRYPAEGYVWYGFSTTQKMSHQLHKDFSDSIAVNCKIQVPAGAALGDYEIEYVYGDEEDNFEKYTDLAWDQEHDNRLIETSTFKTPDGSSEYNTHTFVDVDTKIKVVASSGLSKVSADQYSVSAEGDAVRFEVRGAGAENAIVTVYNAVGQVVDSKVANSEVTTLKAQKGVNVVSILNGNKRSVEKVVIK
ncbi:MAG: T9SS type A sorting domain-containing protein [Muribaculaceae bacterium]